MSPATAVIARRVRRLRTADSDAQAYAVCVAGHDGVVRDGTFTVIWRRLDLTHPIVRWCDVLDELFDAYPDARDVVVAKVASAK